MREAVKTLVEQARTLDPEASYRSVIAEVLDYRTWHEMRIYLRRPGRNDELLTRRTTLSEGDKKLVTVLPMAAAAAAVGLLKPTCTVTGWPAMVVGWTAQSVCS